MKLFKDNQNNIYAYELDGSQDDLIGNKIAITETEAEVIKKQNIQAQFNAMTYAEKRAAEYPSIVDQLDLIYHEGIDAWKEQINTIKEKYPKG
jgi:hypothetical protein